MQKQSLEYYKRIMTETDEWEEAEMRLSGQIAIAIALFILSIFIMMFIFDTYK